MKPTPETVIAYRNEGVLARIQKDCKLTKELAEVLFLNMLQFLYICGTSKVARLSPPHIIDEAWHVFILFTKDYQVFCQEMFGWFIHHQPNLPGESWGNEGLLASIRLAQETFGAELGENWGAVPTSSDQCCSECKPATCNGPDPSCCKKCYGN